MDGFNDVPTNEDERLFNESLERVASEQLISYVYLKMQIKQNMGQS